MMRNREKNRETVLVSADEAEKRDATGKQCDWDNGSRNVNK